MPQTIFVTGATGAQGGHATRELLGAGHTVHAIVRSPDSPAAQALREAGAKIFPGDFDSVDSMVAAAQGCTGAFINVSPVKSDPFHGETKHGQNVVDACLKAGVTRVVQSSVPIQIKVFLEHPILKAFSKNKTAVERIVEEAGFERWTILQVPRLFNTYVPPVSQHMFPDLATQGLIRTALRPDLLLSVLDPLDIGRAVAVVFEDDGDRYQKQKLTMAQAQLTLAQIVDAMNEALGSERVRIQYISEAEAKELLIANPAASFSVTAELAINEHPELIQITGTHDFGLKLHSAKDYFTREKALLEKAISAE